MKIKETVTMTLPRNERLRSLEKELGEGKRIVAFPRSLKPALITPQQLEVLKTAEDEIKDSLLMVYEPDCPWNSRVRKRTLPRSSTS
jgi:hypothetical protein